jgi:hypothetical protein
MAWLIAGHVVALLVDLVAGGRRVADEKDLELALLRHQPRELHASAGVRRDWPAGRSPPRPS